MGVFTRGKTLWIRYRDIDGKWRSESTGCGLDEEEKALKALDKIEAHIRASRTPATVAASGMGVLTVRAFAVKWQASRDIVTKDDDQGRLDNTSFRRSATSRWSTCARVTFASSSRS